MKLIAFRKAPKDNVIMPFFPSSQHRRDYRRQQREDEVFALFLLRRDNDSAETLRRMLEHTKNDKPLTAAIRKRLTEIEPHDTQNQPQKTHLLPAPAGSALLDGTGR